MKTFLLAAAAAALALSAGSALAATAKNAGKTVPGPKQPIPYAELDSYMKASPHMRATKDWWSGQAAETSGANASATAPSSTATPSTPPTDNATTAPK